MPEGEVGSLHLTASPIPSKSQPNFYSAKLYSTTKPSNAHVINTHDTLTLRTACAEGIDCDGAGDVMVVEGFADVGDGSTAVDVALLKVGIEVRIVLLVYKLDVTPREEVGAVEGEDGSGTDADVEAVDGIGGGDVFADGSKTPELAHDANVANAPKKEAGTSPRKSTTEPVADTFVYGNATAVASETGGPVAQFGPTLSDTTVEIT
ncbi:hypothetical protein MMC11_008514 [Xylographa trunciseda]|nr:hypothetical protein [Xylographa trunciseda]